ncbi:MAG: hypothetical protein ABW150_01640 [Candidatus Thiodiazotropha sp.]
MAEEASVNFYRIARCGYFKHGEDIPQFGTLEDTLNELKAWVTDKNLGETCTYAIDDGEEGYHTYCFDIVKSDQTGEFIVTTWNETPSVEGNVASVSATSKVGEVDVELTELPDDHIPGYATYFWFIPDQNILATIRFHHTTNGHQNLRRYMKTFLAKWTSYVVVDDDDDEADHSIIGYRANEDDEPMHLNPMFKSYLKKKPGKIEFITNNREDIRTIHRKNLLSPQSQADMTLFNRMLVKIGVQDPPQVNHEVKVKYEFHHTPEEEELEAIIADWEQEHDAKWDDIGFKLKGDDEIYWLSHSLAKRTIDLDVTRENKEIVNATSILNSVNQNREVLLQELG